MQIILLSKRDYLENANLTNPGVAGLSVINQQASSDIYKQEADYKWKMFKSTKITLNHL